MIGFLERPGIFEMAESLETLEDLADQSAGSHARTPGRGPSPGWGGSD